MLNISHRNDIAGGKVNKITAETVWAKRFYCT